MTRSELKATVFSQLALLRRAVPAKSPLYKLMNDCFEVIEAAHNEPAGDSIERSVRGDRIAAAADAKRELEIFELDGRESGSMTIVGWSALLAHLGLKEAYVRVLFSSGKGKFHRVISAGHGLEDVTIHRPGRWATAGEAPAASPTPPRPRGRPRKERPHDEPAAVPYVRPTTPAEALRAVAEGTYRGR